MTAPDPSQAFANRPIVVHQDARERRKDDQGNKDTATAVDLMKIVAPEVSKLWGTKIDTTEQATAFGHALAAAAEVAWKWSTTDTWPPKP